VCRAHVDHLPFVHRVCVEQTQGRPGKYPGRRTTSPSRWPGWMASLSPPSQSSLISYTYSSFATTAHRQNCPWHLSSCPTWLRNWQVLFNPPLDRVHPHQPATFTSPPDLQSRPPSVQRYRLPNPLQPDPKSNGSLHLYPDPKPHPRRARHVNCLGYSRLSRRASET
jgi:hypothetical protein